MQDRMSPVVAEPSTHTSEALLPSDTPSPSRIPQLDGLRGIAITLVVLYHYFSLHFSASKGTVLWYLIYPTRFGWSGVDLFFVLSGFLIGGILLDAKESRNYFQVFYIRRFFRIVPVYYLVLILFFSITAWFGAHPSPWWPWRLEENLPRYTYFLFLQNIWSAIYSILGSSPLAVCWSLGVEEQFYLTLPLLVRFLSRKRIGSLAVEIILLAPALRLALFSFFPSHPHSWYLLMPCRADSLFFGVLGAILLRDHAWRQRIARNRTIMRVLIILLAVGVPFVTQAQLTARGMVMVSLMFSWLAAFYLLVLIYGLTFATSSLSRILNWTWLRGLGLIAYGVYLFHEGVLDFTLRTVSLGTRFAGSFPYGLAALSAMAVTICLAYMSWQHFEKPLVHFSHRYKYETL
jgi:peptidoglycan/LPS O-acetylase OafA/YrhL